MSFLRACSCLSRCFCDCRSPPCCITDDNIKDSRRAAYFSSSNWGATNIPWEQPCYMQWRISPSMLIVSLSTDAEFVLVDQIIIGILNCHIIRWLQSHCHRSVTSYPPLFLSPLPSFHCLVLGEKHNDVTMQAFVLSFRVYISQKLPPPCFFLACKDFGRMFNHSIPACVFFFLSFLWSGD